MFVYLDNSATTRQYDAVTDKMAQLIREDFGNPSSLHRLGMNAEKAVRTARKQIAAALGAKEEEIIFTSGGTESDNTALLGVAASRKRRGNQIITTKIEHPAIMEAAKRLEQQGFDIKYIGVDTNGVANMQELEALISDDTILISIMAVNNETGAVQPISDIIKLKDEYNRTHNKDILLHTDGVQAFGKIPLATKGIDMISLSAHKIHGPKGMGALYLRKGLNIEPYLVGGGQEHHMRSGTENVPGIVGFGDAAEIAVKGFKDRVEAMSRARSYLLEGIRNEIKDILINGPEQESLAGNEGCCPSVLNVSFLGTRGEVLLHTLEQSEIYISTGSACSSNKKGQSHVLKAMGLNEREIEGALRFSFSEFNTAEQMAYVLVKLKEAVQKFRKLGSFR